MSDQSPSPKPKPGSLRDRIAAFEKPAATSNAPPPPRPKPGNISWKPKQASPPSSPPADASGSTEYRKPIGGMSASDAKESIGKGGSLKERMAALQGKGAFGAPPPVAPKPTAEKPKWKPPPTVARLPDDDDGDGKDVKTETLKEEGTANVDESVKSPAGSAKSMEGNESGPVEAEEEKNGEADPEEERQRRAAIAARMARLGGARVGMEPSVFGRPVIPKKPETLKSETPRSPPPKEEAVKSPEESQLEPHKSPVVEQADVSQEQPKSDYFPAGDEESKPSDSSSHLSPDSNASSPPPPPTRTPNSMPLPAAPRRAGPPRRKVKSPASPPVPEPSTVDEATSASNDEPVQEEVTETSTQRDFTVVPSGGDVQEEIGQVSPTYVEPAPESPEKVLDDEKALAEEPAPVAKTVDDVPTTGTEVTPDVQDEDTSEPEEFFEPEETSGVEETITEPAPAAEEDDEEARRKRVAERVAKMGGFNPFSLPPQRKPTSPSEEVPTSPASISSQRRTSVRKEASIDSVETPESPAQSIRKSSTDSSSFPPPPVRRSSQTSVKFPVSTDRKTSVDSTHAERMSSHEDRVVGASNVAGEHVTPSGIVEEPERETDEPEKTFSEEPHDDDDKISPPSVPARALSSTSISENITEDNATEEYEHEHADVVPEGSDVDESIAESVGPVQQDAIPSPPPAVDLSTRPPVAQPVSNAEPIFIPPPPPKIGPPAASTPTTAIPPVAASDEENNDVEEPGPPVPQRSIPPPRMIPQTPEEEYYPDPDPDGEPDGEEEEDVAPPPVEKALPATTVPEPPRRLPPRPVFDDEGETSDSSVPLPHPHRRSIPPLTLAASQTSDVEDDTAVKVIPFRRMAPPPPSSEDEEAEEIPGEGAEEGEEILPTPPRRATAPEQSSPQQEPLIVPPPPAPLHTRPVSIAQRRAVPVPNTTQTDIDPESVQPPLQTPSLSVSEDSEVLDEDEGDPIDPSFHSPSRRASNVNLHDQDALSSPSLSPSPAALPPAAQTEEQAEDEEQTRRRTIAERMAKLGGIKFGAAPIPVPRPPPAPRRATEDDSQGEEDVGLSEEVSPELTEEEEERARKERIAAKLASMGGMRIGMMPGMMPPRPAQPSVPSAESSSTPARGPTIPSAHPPPSHRAVPPPIPQTLSQSQEFDSEHESQATSEDGVKVEAEESEMEEVSHEDAEEEAPPPVPAREGRRVPSGDSARLTYTPASRPPIPTGIPRRPSTDTTTTARKSSSGSSSVHTYQSTMHKPQSDYVMVEEPETVDPVAAPARIASRPPARAPPPPSAEMDPSESQWEMPSVPSEPVVMPPRTTSKPPARAPPPPAPSAGVEPAESQWEMPSIPSVDFGGSADLSLSWTESDIPAPVREPQAPPPAVNQALSSEDLMAVWGRVGVQVCEVATALHDKSKKALIGDGTYYGFVAAALKEVPNAASISPDSYGHLIYQQSGSSVQKRASEILPGDVLWMQDAKLKGHKGIQTYHQSVGAGDPLVGIVNEFEAKKFKVRVFQANQHVGQQTVESVSYRLEDLKSGLVKVFRVLEV